MSLLKSRSIGTSRNAPMHVDARTAYSTVRARAASTSVPPQLPTDGLMHAETIAVMWFLERCMVSSARLKICGWRVVRPPSNFVSVGLSVARIGAFGRVYDANRETLICQAHFSCASADYHTINVTADERDQYKRKHVEAKTFLPVQPGGLRTGAGARKIASFCRMYGCRWLGLR